MCLCCDDGYKNLVPSVEVIKVSLATRVGLVYELLLVVV